MLYTPDGGKSFIHPTHHKLAALYVQKGDNHTTGSMITLADEDFTSDRPNISLVQSGILSTVLNFLGRCANETFDKVIAEAKGQHVFTPNGVLMSNVGGDLVSPVVWINVLKHAAHIEPSCRLQIAENIGPLVRCMCDDTKRVFFRSNNFWLDGIIRFVELVGYIIIVSTKNSDSSSDAIVVEDEKVVNALLQHEGLLTSIVQWGYWGSRPDIAKELNSLPRSNSTSRDTWIADLGHSVTKDLITDTLKDSDDDRRLTIEGKNRLQAIGSAPIINKAYDPTCMVSYVASLIRIVKTDGWDRNNVPKTEGDQVGKVLATLQILIVDSDCVDKGVITEMVDFGLNYTTDSKTAMCVCLLSSMMILQDDNKYKPIGNISDTRTAFAVRTGLIEMCLGFVEKFGKLESFDIGGVVGKVSLFKHILCTIDLVNKVSQNREGVILQEDDNIQNNLNCKILLDMVWAILDMNGSYCCRCNKSLSKTEVKQCNGCSSMAYCSRACQREDWLNGHNVTCCKSYTNETSGQFQGRYDPEEAPGNERAARKLEDVEKNMNMIQLKLILDNAEDILNQAKQLILPLHDCVVVFDLRCCPPTVEVKDYRDEFDSPESKKGFEETRSKDNITCIYHSRIINGELDEDGSIPHLFMQRLFPHEWLRKKT